MKKITEYFLTDEYHWSDIIWFYGVYAAITIILIITWLSI